MKIDKVSEGNKRAEVNKENTALLVPVRGEVRSLAQ